MIWAINYHYLDIKTLEGPTILENQKKKIIQIFEFSPCRPDLSSIFPTPCKVTHPQTRNISEKSLFVIVVA